MQGGWLAAAGIKFVSTIGYRSDPSVAVQILPLGGIFPTCQVRAWHAQSAPKRTHSHVKIWGLISLVFGYVISRCGSKDGPQGEARKGWAHN
eukprot:6244772-Pyramimonas_sp.AAC.1